MDLPISSQNRDLKNIASEEQFPSSLPGHWYPPMITSHPTHRYSVKLEKRVLTRPSPQARTEPSVDLVGYWHESTGTQKKDALSNQNRISSGEPLLTLAPAALEEGSSLAGQCCLSPFVFLSPAPVFTTLPPVSFDLLTLYPGPATRPSLLKLLRPLAKPGFLRPHQPFK